MTWLAAHTWPWLLVAALLGAVITWLLLVRRVAVLERTVTTTARRQAAVASPVVTAALADAGTIKGNANSMLYHTLESPFYAATEAEEWFVTEDAAQSAGYTRWDATKDAAGLGLLSIPDGAFGPGSADPRTDGSAPSDAFTIKGNADSMLYHTVKSPYYGRTKAEVWFSSEDAARAAGFKRGDDR